MKVLSNLKKKKELLILCCAGKENSALPKPVSLWQKQIFTATERAG